jgi:transposase-like protein
MCELGARYTNTETKTKHKCYDEAFKKSAVEHWLISGKSARQIAVGLGINVQNLSKWKQKFKALPAGQVAATLEALQAENRRLQRELHRVAQQRDILKNLGHNLRTTGGGLNG